MQCHAGQHDTWKKTPGRSITVSLSSEPAYKFPGFFICMLAAFVFLPACTCKGCTNYAIFTFQITNCKVTVSCSSHNPKDIFPRHFPKVKHLCFLHTGKHPFFLQKNPYLPKSPLIHLYIRFLLYDDTSEQKFLSILRNAPANFQDWF